jgi:DNA modification methylase
MELNKIYCGDAAAVMRAQIPDESVDLTVTSPPYDQMRAYKGYSFDFEAIARELYRVTKPGGVVVWVVQDETIDGSESGTSLRQALYFMEMGFRKHDTMIFHKTGVNYPPGPKRYWQVWEYMFVFSKGTPKTFNPIDDIEKKWAGSWGKTYVRQKDGTLLQRKMMNEGLASLGKSEGEGKYGFRMRDNVWVIQTGKRFGHKDEEAYEHPATFPEDLAEGHIITWTNPGDVVLDPMAGSCTTAKMALLHKRHYIAIDSSSEYCELGRKRLKKYE